MLQLPRQVGSVCVGMEPWQLFMLIEQVRCTNRGGISGCGPSGSRRESPSRMLKESSSWFTVLESDGDPPSTISCSTSSAFPLPHSWYSTSKSVSLSVTMQQPDTFSVHMQKNHSLELQKQWPACSVYSKCCEIKLSTTHYTLYFIECSNIICLTIFCG